VAAQYANPKTRYIVIPTGTADTCFFRADYFPTSLNDCGDMVGYTEDSPLTGCGRSPWIWSLCRRFGLGPQTKVLLNDLSTPSGPVPSGEGLAWGINNDGDVVGEQILNGGSLRVPFVWRFGATGLASAYAVGPTNEPGVLRGVSESSGTTPAHVVGTTAVGALSEGFYHVLGQPAGTIVDLPPVSASAASAGFGVALATDGGTPRLGGAAADTAAGAGFPSGGGPGPGGSGPPTGGNGTPDLTCDLSGPVHGVRWRADVTPSGLEVREDFLTPADPLDVSQWNARIYSVDGSNRAAGEYVDPDLTCLSRAAFWRANGVAESLGLIAPLTVDTETRAFSIAPFVAGGSTLVVGAETAIFQTGVIWWRGPNLSGGIAAPFEATLASQLRLSDCIWSIASITDVNAKGWMSAEARAPSLDDNYYAVLLIPYNCPADIDFDGVIGAADLALVLGAWGSCPTTICSCSADANVDGIVDGADIAVVIGAWGTSCSLDFCAGCGDGAPFQGEQILGGGSLGVEFDVVLGMTGQPDAAAFAAWVAELSAEQRNQLAASIAALVGQEGGVQ
jgi:hypothetical protein